MSAPGTSALPPTPRSVAHTVIWLTAAFAAVLTLWAVFTPAFRSPDEVRHFSSVMRLTEGFSWPDPGDALTPGAVEAAYGERSIAADDRSTLAELEKLHPDLSTSTDWMTQHPPTYYLAAAGVVTVLGADEWRWDHTLLLLRLLGVGMVAPLVWFAFSATRRLTRSDRAGLVAATTPFLIPQLHQIAASASNDPPLILLGALVAWLGVRLLDGDRRWLIALSLGAGYGLLTFVKGTGLAAGLFVVGALLFGRHAPQSWRARIGVVAAAFAVAFSTGGWWWLLNLIRFGTVQPSGTLELRPDNPWPEGYGPHLPHWVDALWNGFSSSFWGKFGGLEYPIAAPVSDALTVIALSIIAVGLITLRNTERVQAIVLAAYPVGTALLLFYGTWSVYVRTQSVYATQGRYFYGTIVALAALGAMCCMAIMRDHRTRSRTAIAVVVLSGFMSAYGLLVAYFGFYESSYFKITYAGIATWSTTSPAGVVGILVVTTTAIALGTVGMTRTLRAIRTQVQ